MTQSNITVQVVNFRPHYMGGCLAEMELKNSVTTSPAIPTDGNVEVPTNYKIRLKRNLVQPSPNPDLHEVVFSIQAHPQGSKKDENYFLVGIYFINREMKPKNDPDVTKNVGRNFITNFACNLNANLSTLTLTIDRNAATKGQKLEFMLLVQQEKDGEVGIIDPEWENEN